MYWILAAIFIVIALAVPRLRPAGIAGCVVLGALLAWGMVQRLRHAPEQSEALQERGRPSSPAAVVQSIELRELRAEDLQLSGGGAPFELRGRIVNSSSDTQLKSVTIHLTRRDCYEGALDPSGCVVLWQDRHWIPLHVPAGQSRDFAASIWMRGAAMRSRGTVRDSFEIVAATGTGASEAPGQREDK